MDPVRRSPKSPDTNGSEGTVPLPPRDHYQNNAIAVAWSVCDTGEDAARGRDRDERVALADAAAFFAAGGVTRERTPRAVAWLNSQ